MSYFLDRTTEMKPHDVKFVMDLKEILNVQEHVAAHIFEDMCFEFDNWDNQKVYIHSIYREGYELNFLFSISNAKKPTKCLQLKYEDASFENTEGSDILGVDDFKSLWKEIQTIKNKT